MQQIMLLIYTYDRKHEVPSHVTHYLAFTNAGQVALSNIMIRLCTLGVYELITALRIPALLLVQWYQFRVVEARVPVLCALSTAAFAACGTWASSHSANAIGVAVGIAAVLAAALSKAAVKGYVMQYDTNPDDLLRAQVPGTIAILASYSAIVEQPAYPSTSRGPVCICPRPHRHRAKCHWLSPVRPLSDVLPAAVPVQNWPDRCAI